MKPTSERDFEEAIEAYLLTHGGYSKADNSQFDPALALDPHTLVAFLQETQPDTWEKLTAVYGTKNVASKVVQRIAKECDTRGLLDVVRNGITDRGHTLNLAYFRPPTRLNPHTDTLYQQNRLTIMRQIYYDTASRKSIDMLLSLNGLPIATVELKNAFTGQNTKNAIAQYFKDRIPSNKTPLIQFKKRALVHFAVDTDIAYMTTGLGKRTHFLPFNTGNNGGKGNPANHSYSTGYKTGYLWEEVWARECWLDIIHRFIHLHIDDKTKKEKIFFPRYHQLAATRKLLAATRAHGSGQNYLIQHSAGSGKTNTISWTAHQLASLHNDDDKPIFNSVIVISDRRNLDKQLQDNIYQIEHKQGVVAKIDEDKHASDLAAELNAGTKIIITTLQKFSFLMGKVDDLSDKTFAVIVDEAHSSQSGRSAGNLRGVLGESDDPVKTQFLQETGFLMPDIEDLIIAEAKRRGPQSNISFYAFTATPKHKTLEMFGIIGDDGKPHPFHLYSMRQAIEEKFIFDVLKNYTTYKTYYELSKAIEDDPDVDEKKAKKAIARFVSLHPHNIAQKVEIIVEHYRRFTRSKIKGNAKAMVVTRSRLHVVRYKQAFDAYIHEKGYSDIKALVAFSGTVDDPDDDPDADDRSYSEAGMNGFSEKELPRRFSTPEYQLLIVAEKYQTGFDQPLLHTMFVDKKLADLKAVQTLSRLNRATADKDRTFVLDFVNTVEEIQEAFKPYYEQTAIEQPTDPNQLYTLQTKLRQAPILRQLEMDAFADIFFKPQQQQSKRDHGQLNKWIDPAVARFDDVYGDPPDDAGEQFKSNLQAYIRLYSFLSQIIDWQDVELEKLYAYGRLLLTKLPYRAGGGMMVIDDEVALSAYRNEITFAGDATLAVGETQPVWGITAVGTGRDSEDKFSPLSEIIELINGRFGTDWKEEDLLLIEQIVGDMVRDKTLAQQGRANSKEQFRPVFEQYVLKAFIQRQGRNEELINRFMSDPEIRELLIKGMLDDVYGRVQVGG